MADMTDIATRCSGEDSFGGRHHSGRAPTLQGLLNEMKALGAVLPGHCVAAEGASHAPDRGTAAGSGRWPDRYKG
ncbi:MAG: hypothetical protein Q7J44_02120 [Pseudotabrizicola sp.]|uniref:hypothetical protein n=1 Tax=Pseudotabrizicola sp. TaxID=2939647 RepID=UPI0027269456|nr:hypothetical protein [Pseudotabrizicola sp.]MDO9637319.1 hypothetical protein [Pseudotabrizicola sp.]